MVTEAAQMEIWNREYQEIRSIPSSTRRLPSKALLLFEKILDFNKPRRVLDAGCGNGRNAVYLGAKGSHVVAVDFSSAALATVKSEVEPSGIGHRISLEKVDLLDALPFSDGTFDLCLDSYVSCHFTNNIDHTHYWSELSRVTRPGGHIFSSVFASDDEYYSKLAKKQHVKSTRNN